jgi:protein arginine kinase activator
MHLCPECAEAQKLLQQEELNLSVILQTVIGQHVSPVTDELARLSCPLCKIKYMEFRAEGRLGCPHDYQVFRTALQPLLQRIHRKTHHVGKSPRNAERTRARQAELLELRLKLLRAVEAEDFEKAARLRDLLKQKESENEPG